MTTFRAFAMFLCLKLLLIHTTHVSSVGVRLSMLVGGSSKSLPYAAWRVNALWHSCAACCYFSSFIFQSSQQITSIWVQFSMVDYFKAVEGLQVLSSRFKAQGSFPLSWKTSEYQGVLKLFFQAWKKCQLSWLESWKFLCWIVYFVGMLCSKVFHHLDMTFGEV